MGKTAVWKMGCHKQARRWIPNVPLGLMAWVLYSASPPSAYAALPCVSSSTKPCSIADLDPIVANIIKVSVALAGIALFAMLLLGGIQYLTSGGEPKAAQQAKNTITYGIIGIALLVLAWFVLVFIQQFTGVKVTIFTVPTP